MEKKLSGNVNSVYDIAKLFLCFVIVAIHTWILPKPLYPLARLAVPLFFIISSVFFFSKVGKCGGDLKKEQTALKGFVKRNLQLYLFWFIVLLPFTWKIKEWFTGGSKLLDFLDIIKAILFSSSFRASWFIMALAIATVIVYYASKLVDNRVLLVLAIVIYIAVCARSSYYDHFKNYGIIETLVSRYELVYSPAYNSFPVAIVWVTCGKCFADKTFSMKMKPSLILLAVSLAALYAEWYFVRKHGWGHKNDCYLMLFPASVALFSILTNIKPFAVKGSLTMRNMSTVIYALHATMATVLREMVAPRFDKLAFLAKNNYAVFGCVVLICLVACAVLLTLEKVKILRFLKYSH